MKIKKRTKLPMLNGSEVVVEESLEEQGSKPLCETLRDFDSVIESLESTKDGKKYENVLFPLLLFFFNCVVF